MEQELGRCLHILTARMDRAGDAFLRREAGVSYRRFLALFMVGMGGADTQRVLADRLGVTEPSVSRMTRVLGEQGLLETAADPSGGNRHRLVLTAAGEQLVTRWGGELERRLAALVDASGVPYDSYLEHTKCLLDQVDAPHGRQQQRSAPPVRRSLAGTDPR
jgi:DNA-binding MarR family transcriptional regulator